MNSTICVIIPYYNDIHITEAVDSVLNQTVKTDCIIVDDASDYLPHLTKKVTVVRHNKNKGPGYAVNTGLKIVLKNKYEYIGIMASDAILSSRFIEEALKYLHGSNVSGVCAERKLANKENRVAQLSYRYVIYKGQHFQLDASLWKKGVFTIHHIPDLRQAEDAMFILSFKDKRQLKIIKPSYLHYEPENVKEFLWKTFVYAKGLYMQSGFKTVKLFLATPITCMKMLLIQKWIVESLFFPLRQLIRLIGFLRGVNYVFEIRR